MTYHTHLPQAWCRKHLTPAEQSVVELVGAGLPTKVAAARLCKSTLTVRNQLNNAMRKLGVSSRYELIALLNRTSVPATPGSLLETRLRPHLRQSYDRQAATFDMAMAAESHSTMEVESFAYAI